MPHHLQTVHVWKLQIADRQMMSTLFEAFDRFGARCGCVN